jgi:hypothetical protein
MLRETAGLVLACIEGVSGAKEMWSDYRLEHDEFDICI